MAKKLTPEQEALIRAEYERLAKPPEDSATGIGQTVGSALREIPEGLAKAGTALTDWERNKAADIAEYFGADPETVANIRKFTPAQLFRHPVDDPANQLPTDQDIENRSNQIVGAPSRYVIDPMFGTNTEQGIKDWTQHVPETPLEEDVGALSSFLPAIATKNPAGLAGGRALLSKALTRVGLPAMMTEAAGDIAHEVAPDAENPVRFLVGIISQPQAWKSGAAKAAVRDVSSRPGAMNKLRELILQQFGDSPDAMRQATEALVELGIPEGATFMDIGGGMRQAGAQIFAKGGEGRTAIETKLKGREAGADVRGEQLIRENVGAQVDEGLLMDALKARKQAGAKAQEAAHPAQVADVDLAPIEAAITTQLASAKSPKIRKALESVRRMLYGKAVGDQPPPLETGSAEVLAIRQAIGEMLYQADGSPNPKLGPKQKQVLDDLYAKVNEQLDPANPTLRAADEDIAQAGKEGRAFKTGKEDVIDADTKTAIAPEQFARTWDALSAGEKATMRQGLTSRIDAMRGLTANDRAALKRIIVGEGKWNHQKIATIIGDEAAANLVRGLEREKTFQKTEQDVMYGSKTAGTQTFDQQPAGVDMARKAVERTAAGGALAGVEGAIAGGLTAPITSGLNKLGDWVTAGNRAELGKLLSSGRPQDITRAIETMRGSSGNTGLLMMALLARRAQQEQEEQR